MQDAVIVSAVRTAVGKAPKGTLSVMRPDDELIPGRDDLDFIAESSGFVAPGESELTAARAGIAELKWGHITESTRRRLRESSPVPMWKSEEVEL